jgi:flagellin-like protein
MKHFKKLLRGQLRDQRGVSPVIGVILMVAITVIMGAVVAMFAYGYLGNAPKAPNIALSVIDNPIGNSSLIIKDTGGESIVANDWKYSVTALKESPAVFETTTGAISTGTSIPVLQTTDDTPVDIGSGWYHVVIVHVGSDTILLDTSVLVR